MAFGLFGKLPQKRDFLSVNLPPAVLHPFETWLQQGVAASRSEIGRGWEDFYLVAPIWRFWLGREIFGTPCAGALMPSVDQVGRYFPLAIIYLADPGEALPPPLQAPLDEWYRAIEQRLLSVLSEDDRADVGNLLAGLPKPADLPPPRPPVLPAGVPTMPEPAVPEVPAAPVVAAPIEPVAPAEPVPVPAPMSDAAAPMVGVPAVGMPPLAVPGEAPAGAPATPPAEMLHEAPAEPEPAPPALPATPLAMPALDSISWDLPETAAPGEVPAGSGGTPEPEPGPAAGPPETAPMGDFSWDLPENPPPDAGLPVAADGAGDRSTPEAPSQPPRKPDVPDSPEPPAPPVPPREPPRVPGERPPAGPGDNDPPSVSSAPPGARLRPAEFRGSLFVAVESEGTIDVALAELRDLDYRYAAAGRSYWWCAASAQGSALLHAAPGLPDPYFFSRMLLWQGPERR